MNITNIIAGVDFSPPSDVAVRSAIHLARRHKARLHLVYAGAIPEAIDPKRETTFSDAVRAMNSAEFGHAREQLDALTTRLGGDGTVVETAVIDGPPAQALEKAARELRADLLVVGSHGRTGAQRFFLGSVAERVIRIAPCSVFVARSEFPETGATRVLVPIDFTDSSAVTVGSLPAFLGRDPEVELFHAWGPVDATMYGAAWALSGGVENLRQQLHAAAQKQAEPLLATLRLHAPLHPFPRRRGLRARRHPQATRSQPARSGRARQPRQATHSTLAGRQRRRTNRAPCPVLGADCPLARRPTTDVETPLSHGPYGFEYVRSADIETRPRSDEHRDLAQAILKRAKSLFPDLASDLAWVQRIDDLLDAWRRIPEGFAILGGRICLLRRR